MGGKRRRNDTVDSPSKSEDPADDTVEPPADSAKPVYLVAKRCARKPAYSVIKVDAAAVAGGHDTPPPARNLGEFAGARARRGMSFVAAHSKHGSWIVGVGGRRGQIAIYDPSTREEFTGPGLRMLKHEPILICHGGTVYAMSRRPKVHIKATRDFQPWFECIDFNKGMPRILHGDSCCWRALPPPPFFPCFLTPEQFRNPPDITVSSYAAVGTYILISLQQEDKGTYAFHVVKKTWEKVCDKGLPFVGQAVPLGGNLFAAGSVVSDNGATAVSVFHMSIKTSTPELSPELVTSVLSVQELPVASEGEIPRPLFCPLGKGSFCSIREAARQSQEANYLVDPQIIMTAFQMDNIEATLAAEDYLQAPVPLKQHNRTYGLNVGPGCFDLPMHVVASLSMDNEHIELFQKETTQERETTAQRTLLLLV